jgi:hypothetical protein
MSKRNFSSRYPGFRSLANELLPGVFALLLAFPFAFLMNSFNNMFPDQPEKVVAVLMVLSIILLVMPPVIYLLMTRRLADPSAMVLVVLLGVSILLVSIYFFWVRSAVTYPGDFLTWSEGDFVSDILKVQTGYPIYTPQVNNESFIYTPGCQLLTYFLAWTFKNPNSIPVYRMIQIGYTLLAVLGAFLCIRVILRISPFRQQMIMPRLWGKISILYLFLIATNSVTNPFIHALHNDSLAQLYSVIAFLLLLTYIWKHDKRLLIVMMFVPAAGFLVKQNLIIWAPLYCFHLAFFDRPFSLKRLTVFALASFGAIGLTVFGCYLIWGKPFLYWTFMVTGKHPFSALRSFQHMMNVWVYYALGLSGGLILLRGKVIQKLLSPWLIWLAFISIETYTSGIAWMTNHIGPGSLISGVWFLAGLRVIWPEFSRFIQESSRPVAWLKAGISIMLVGFLFSGLGVVRIPLPAMPKDAYRYLHEIEQQFEGESAKDILLDVGSWVYIKDKVIMKDRAPSIGDRGYGEIGDFSGIIQRIEQHRYSKILLRNYHSPDFSYDHYLWRKSSGIRKALLNNYHEVGLIKGVKTFENPFFNDISVLVPNPGDE